MGVAEVGRLGHQDDVGQEGDVGPEADGGAVHRRHHRQREDRHLVDDLGRLVEEELAGGMIALESLEQVHVAASAEGPAGARDHHRPEVGLFGKVTPQAGNGPVQRRVGGVEGVGPVERHQADGSVLLEKDFGGERVVHGEVSSGVRSDGLRKGMEPGQRPVGQG